MFRRKRGSSRPPAASAWWPVSPDDDGSERARGVDQAPPLPTEDPFGGWPAFGPGDPTDAVLGQPDPMSGWVSPATPPSTGTATHTAPGHAAVAGQDTPAGPTGPPGQTSPSAHASQPGHARAPGHANPPRQTSPPGGQAVPHAAVGTSGPSAASAFDGGQPAPAAARSPASARTTGAAPTAAEAMANGMDAGHTEWLPLLTHADDDQRFQARPGGHPPAAAGVGPQQRNGRPRTKRRAGRGLRGHRPSPPAGVPDPAPATAVPADTDWLDPVAPPHPMEAAALAGAFAADYLSWDEQAPERRGQVLAQYLPSDVVGNAALLGWSGKGRQRAEFALPGAVRPDGEGRVVVDVRVRVTPYRAVGQPSAPAPVGDLEVAGVPAVAPAPTARGWKSLDSYWVRLTVPVNRDQGRLVVDTWDEQLGEEPEPRSATGTPADPATAEDLEDTGTATNEPAGTNNPAGTDISAAGRSEERGRPGAPRAGGSR
jgi:hypothetical protein